MRTMIADTVGLVGKKVTVRGWVQVRRDHGKLIFIDLRDRSGILQVVFWGGGDADLFTKAATLRSEFVVTITGAVQKRGEKQINTDSPTGTVELAAETLEILNESETPFFEIDKASEVKEEIRMQYRY